MKYSTCAKKTFAGRKLPKTVDTVRFFDRYIDLETVKEKATGIVSIVIAIGVIAFSFFGLVFM